MRPAANNNIAQETKKGIAVLVSRRGLNTIRNQQIELNEISNYLFYLIFLKEN